MDGENVDQQVQHQCGSPFRSSCFEYGELNEHVFSVHRRKYTQRLQEQEEHIETLVIKVNNLEKQKSRLQSEVEVLIIDLEKANNTARELQKRVEHYERVNIELKSRLDETLQVNTANNLLSSCQIIKIHPGQNEISPILLVAVIFNRKTMSESCKQEDQFNEKQYSQKE